MNKKYFVRSILAIPYIPFFWIFFIRPTTFIESPLFYLYLIITISEITISLLWDALKGNPEVESKLDSKDDMTFFKFGTNYRTHFLGFSLLLIVLFIFVGISLKGDTLQLMFSGIIWGLLLFIYNLIIKRIILGKRVTNPEIYKLEVWSGKSFLDQMARMLILAIIVILIIVALVIFGILN